jgi:hypothetical protein
MARPRINPKRMEITGITDTIAALRASRDQQ